MHLAASPDVRANGCARSWHLRPSFLPLYCCPLASLRISLLRTVNFKYPRAAGGARISAARACRAPGPPSSGLGVIGLRCPPSSRPSDRGRRCFCLFCAAPAGCSLLCAAVCALLSRAAGGGTSPACLGEALFIGACFCAVLQVSVGLFLLCRARCLGIYSNRSKQEYARCSCTI